MIQQTIRGNPDGFNVAKGSAVICTDKGIILVCKFCRYLLDYGKRGMTAWEIPQKN